MKREAAAAGEIGQNKGEKQAQCICRTASLKGRRALERQGDKRHRATAVQKFPHKSSTALDTNSAKRYINEPNTSRDGAAR